MAKTPNPDRVIAVMREILESRHNITITLNVKEKK